MSHTMPPRSAAARACAPWQATADPCLHRRHLNTQRSDSVSCGISGSWCAQGFIWVLWATLAGMGFDSKCDFCPSYYFVGASPLPLKVRYLFLVVSNILLLMVIQQQVAVLEFSQEKISTCPSSLLSWEVRTFQGVDLTEAEDIKKRW